MARRRGNPTAFWSNASVAADGVSSVVDVGEGIESVVIKITVSAATTVTVEAALEPGLSTDGIRQDFNPVTATWGTLYYIDSPLQIVFASSGTAHMVVPDFAPLHVRLRSSAAATITAGWEGNSDS